MNQNEVLEFDGFRVERESFLGGIAMVWSPHARKMRRVFHIIWRWSLTYPKQSFSFPSVILTRWFLAMNFLPAVGSRSWFI